MERPLRISYLLSHFHPRASGAERQAQAQGRELVRRGHEVRVLTRAIPGLPRNDEVDGIRIHRWIATISAGPLFGLSFVASTVAGLRRLRSECDLIHTHQALWESISCGVARPWLSGLPTIIQPASSGFYGEAEEMARTKGFPILRRIAVRNTAFVAISEEIERQWLRLGVPPSRMTRLASGVDTDRFRPGPSTLESSLPARRPRVVFTGRIHLQKNLDILIDIWGNVARETGASLVLVGQGEERPRLEQRVAEMGLNERVVFVGAADDPSEHLRAADLFVLPSVAEGMSNSLLEAMSTGLPCIASEIGGNIDLLGDGAGLLVPPDDRPAWTKALIGSLKDEGLRTRLGRAARAKIEAEFGLSSVVDRYLELYGRLLESPA